MVISSSNFLIPLCILGPLLGQPIPLSKEDPRSVLWIDASAGRKAEAQKQYGRVCGKFLILFTMINICAAYPAIIHTNPADMHLGSAQRYKDMESSWMREGYGA